MDDGVAAISDIKDALDTAINSVVAEEPSLQKNGMQVNEETELQPQVNINKVCIFLSKKIIYFLMTGNIVSFKALKCNVW